MANGADDMEEISEALEFMAAMGAVGAIVAMRQADAESMYRVIVTFESATESVVFDSPALETHPPRTPGQWGTVILALAAMTLDDDARNIVRDEI